MKTCNAGLVILIALSISLATPAQEAKPPPGSIELEYIPTLTVGGRGEVFARPDRALVRLGAQAQAEDAAAAQASVNEVMKKALDQIKKLGIAERFIRTSGLNLYPVYTNPGPDRAAEEPRVAGYRAANTIQITVDDLALIGKIIDAGVSSGANRLEGVTFELRDDRSQRKQAMEQAIAEARSKAMAMAPALEVKLGKLREVIEGGVAIEPPQPLFARTMRASFGAADTPVQPGELRIEASVTLRYEILP